MISNLSKTIFVCSMSILIFGLASAAVVHAEDDYGGSSHSGHDEANRYGAGEISHMGTNQNTSSPEGPSARRSSLPADLEAIDKFRAERLSQLESMTVTQDTETTPSCMLLRSYEGISELICGTGNNQDVLLIDKATAADTQRRLESDGGVTIPFDTQMQVCALADDNFLTSTARSFLAAASVARRGAGGGVAALNTTANTAFVLAAGGGTWRRLWRQAYKRYMDMFPTHPGTLDQQTDEMYKRLIEQAQKEAQKKANELDAGPIRSTDRRPGTVYKLKTLEGSAAPQKAVQVRVDHAHDPEKYSHSLGMLVPHAHVTVGKDPETFWIVWPNLNADRPFQLTSSQFHSFNDQCVEIEELMKEARLVDVEKRKAIEVHIQSIMRDIEKELKKMAAGGK